MLAIRSISTDDYEVRAGDRPAGRIMTAMRAGGRRVWFWTVTGPYIPAELQPSSGECDSLEEAKAEFRAKFERWQAWADEQRRHPLWHGREGG